MRAPAVIGGILLAVIVLWDAFETIILSRRISRKLRLTRPSGWMPPAGAPDNWEAMT